TPAEADWLAACGPEVVSRDFLRLWCAKEAVLKAHGRGLAFGLDRLGLLNEGGRLCLASFYPALVVPEAWQVLEIRPASGFLGTVAWIHPDGPAAPAGEAGPGHTARP